MVPTKYVVIDIETTGFRFLSDRIIEIAAVAYEDGCKVAEFNTLIDPEIPIPLNITNLTGISQADVCGAPRLIEVKDKFLSVIADLPIVGHNIRTFDIPFLTAQMGTPITNPLIDTLELSRNAFHSLPCHKLVYLSKVLQIKTARSHRALDDVETTNQLFLACQKPEEYEELIQNKNEFQDLRERIKKEKVKARFEPRINIRDIKPLCGCPDPSGALCSKTIVFTGSLSISRAEAMQMAVNVGAILKSSVTTKTAYLVVGGQDISRVGVDGMSTKEEKAHALNAAGKANIQIISEEEFLRMVTKESESV